MLAMQYSIQLPPNYDTELITERVNARRGLFDEHAGLVHKSFLYNERERLYAPFYIWKDVSEARNFLMDELFSGVVETFTRHRVRSWYVVDAACGNKAITPTYARREVDVISPEIELDSFIKKEKSMQAELIKNPDLYMDVLAIDADRWEILHFTLWKDKLSAAKSASDSCMGYRVLHVSEPSLCG